MREIALYASGAGLTLFVSLGVVIYLRPHLHVLLAELCGTAERANFWTAFSNITLTLTPLIFALHSEPEESVRVAAALALGTQLKHALIGLLLSVLVLGMILAMFIPRREANDVRAPATRAA